jgi:hypothetical protein
LPIIRLEARESNHRACHRYHRFFPHVHPQNTRPRSPRSGQRCSSTPPPLPYAYHSACGEAYIEVRGRTTVVNAASAASFDVSIHGSLGQEARGPDSRARRRCFFPLVHQRIIRPRSPGAG